MTIKSIVILLFYGLVSAALQAQPADATLTAEVKTNTIAEIARLLETNYIFPDKAEQTGKYLREQLQTNQLAGDTIPEFAQSLTAAIQAVTNDKHLRVNPIPVAGTVPTKEQAIGYWQRSADQRRTTNEGFIEVKVLPNNIGYLDFRFFAPPELGGSRADAAMQLLENTDAIIIDLRHNGGGNPAMVQYICSYFFDKKILLNSLYWRANDQTDEFWVLDEVNGKKRPDVPLFILTSKRTFSGAEEFTYNMQTRERATIVGETTGGGAHPGGGFVINDYYQMFIATGRAINPVTKTNWEGVGVIPDVQVSADEALDKALTLATEAVNERQAQFKDRYTVIMSSVWDTVAQAENLLQQGNQSAAEEIVTAALSNAIAEQVLVNDSILALGIEYRQRFNKPEVAKLLFNAGLEIDNRPALFHSEIANTCMEQQDFRNAAHHYELAYAAAKKAEQSPRFLTRLESQLTEAKSQIQEE